MPYVRITFLWPLLTCPMSMSSWHVIDQKWPKEGDFDIWYVIWHRHMTIWCQFMASFCHRENDIEMVPRKGVGVIKLIHFGVIFRPCVSRLPLGASLFDNSCHLKLFSFSRTTVETFCRIAHPSVSRGNRRRWIILAEDRHRWCADQPEHVVKLFTCRCQISFTRAISRSFLIMIEIEFDRHRHVFDPVKLDIGHVDVDTCHLDMKLTWDMSQKLSRESSVDNYYVNCHVNNMSSPCFKTFWHV